MADFPIIPIPVFDPAAAFAALGADSFAMLLQSAAPALPGGGISYLLPVPDECVMCQDGDDPFAALESLTRRLPPATTGPVPFMGGAVGFLSYEARRFIEPAATLPPDDLGVPDLAAARFSTLAAIDHRRGMAWAIGPRASALAKELAAIGPAPPLPPAPGLTLTPEITDGAAEEAISRILAYIAAGDIYQANYTRRFFAPRPPGLDVAGLYRRLSALSPAPFAALIKAGDTALLSASPERFLSLNPQGHIETRPIKGTRPRGATPDADAALAAELAGSAKDRAENLMIVDLLRNDLSGVARIGSVKVPQLIGLESFPAVHHLVSVVTAELSPGLGPVDLLRATFPGGSITGAPKIRAMQIIDEIEGRRRGAYCGSVFRIGADGSLDSSIIIRTLTLRPGRIIAQAGGGIVADSRPEAENAETAVKLAGMVRALTGENRP